MERIADAAEVDQMNVYVITEAEVDLTNTIVGNGADLQIEGIGTELIYSIISDWNINME